MSHLTPAQQLAAGLHPPPSVAEPWAAVQAAWRFYANPRVTLPRLARPLVAAARAGVSAACDRFGLVILDWCQAHLNGHRGNADRTDLAHRNDHGYELLSALLVGDRDGAPIAPVAMEVRSADGVWSTRAAGVRPAPSQLDGLGPLMAEAERLKLGFPLVFVVDAEADSVAHYRAWAAAGHRFAVRADAGRSVLDGAGERRTLGAVADRLKAAGGLKPGPAIDFKGRPARTFVGEAAVVLDRPARPHRVDPADGKRKHRTVPGGPLPLRLVVSEVRDARGNVLARWLLLTNVPAAKADAATVARWYAWRWRVESYHKLLKRAGHFLEQWRQATAAAFARRLAVASMACVVVWRLARDPTPAAAGLRGLLVRLSGRQQKRGPGRPGFTLPALLAGLGVLLPALHLARRYTPAQLRAMAAVALPGLTLPGDNSA